MSLDISVYNPETGETIDMNWLRNPYGLCNWAEANYNYKTESRPDDESEQRLWHVVNNWAYDTSDQVDRKLFLDVVRRYGQVLLHDLNQGYFFFTEKGLEQFVLPHLSLVQVPIYEPPAVKIGYPHKEYGIPMDYLGHSCFGLSDRYRSDAHTLRHYQAWCQQLIDFAELLQVPGTTFYCSN